MPQEHRFSHMHREIGDKVFAEHLGMTAQIHVHRLCPASSTTSLCKTIFKRTLMTSFFLRAREAHLIFIEDSAAANGANSGITPPLVSPFVIPSTNSHVLFSLLLFPLMNTAYDVLQIC
jgi:hypothetical protein